MNESEEVPYVVANGYTTNMSNEAEDVINKYKNLLIALEPFRKEFMKNHSGLQLQRWDIGIVQIKGTKKIGFFAKEYAKKEYDEFIFAYKKLGFSDQVIWRNTCQILMNFWRSMMTSMGNLDSHMNSEVQSMLSIWFLNMLI